MEGSRAPRMSNPLEHCTPAPIELFGGGHDGYEVKFGSVVRRVSRADELDGLSCIILGLPTDEGVRRNHGRIGAALAPAAIRRAFYRLNAVDAFRRGVPHESVGDIGNIEVAADLADSQRRLALVVERLLRRGIDLIVVDGGHETAAGHLLGHLALGHRISVFNVDPHLDVRNMPGDRPTSGNPFRLALDAAAGRMRYACLGARVTANAAAYADFVIESGGDIHWEPLGGGFAASASLEAELAAEGSAHIVISLDVDAARSGEAPGSSAASPIGLDPAEFVRCAALAGADDRVRGIELSECSPPFDRDYQTEKLCALAMQAFLLARYG